MRRIEILQSISELYLFEIVNKHKYSFGILILSFEFCIVTLDYKIVVKHKFEFCIVTLDYKIVIKHKFEFCIVTLDYKIVVKHKFEFCIVTL